MRDTSFLIMILIMVCSETIASSSQMLLKKSAGITYRSRIREYLNGYVICGYGLLFLSMLLTIAAYRFSDSYMNVPVLETMGYILVMILGRIFFAEKITKNKVIGMCLILAGIVIYYL
ncbi:MAG: multidrug ABC transporter [Eubacteriales bacterium]|nr:multidrug ABC transporter [Eubacteriales bacterium]